MKQIIALAGPPHSGKDTIADMIQQQVAATKVAIAMPMRLAGFALLNEEYSEELYAELKETSLEEFNGMNFRQWMIDFSETYMKERFGQQVFGTLGIRTILNQPFPTAVLSDSGFLAEQMEIVNHFGTDNYLYVRLTRDGCDWSKDSRSYIDFDDSFIETLTVENNSTPEQAADIIIGHCLSLGWTF